MVIQRALDKPLMGKPYTPVILIKGKKFSRRMGRIMKGLTETSGVVYYEYENIEEVMRKWTELLSMASERKE